MTVLVTGGSGVLGLHVARGMAEHGDEVVALSMSGAPPAAELVLGELASRVTFVRGDIRDFESLRVTADRFKVNGIVHTAALTGEAQALAKPLEVVAVNVTGTANVLEVARLAKMRRVVCIGSSAEYGQRLDARPIREDELNVQGVYAETKFLAHTLGQRYRESFGLDVLTVRVSSVYGPNTRFNAFRGLVGNTLVAYLCRAVAFGEPVTLNDDNDYARGWTYAADSARGVCLAFHADRLRHRVYNIASGMVYTLADVIDALRRAEPAADIRVVAGGSGGGIAASTARGSLDITRAREDFGFAPQVDLQQGVRAYISWWRRLGADAAARFSGSGSAS